jgi:hypothetical protein
MPLAFFTDVPHSFSMTPRQLSAIGDPINPKDLDAVSRFAQEVTKGGRRFGTVLTVDRTAGEYSWHVMVSVLDADLRPVPLLKLRDADRRAAESLAKELIGNVGVPGSDERLAGEKAFQMRRRLTISEEKQARHGLSKSSSHRSV